MGFKEIVRDRLAVLFYGNLGHPVGCIGRGIERATVVDSSLVRGKFTIRPEGLKATVDVAGHQIHEPIMPQVS